MALIISLMESIFNDNYITAIWFTAESLGLNGIDCENILYLFIGIYLRGLGSSDLYPQLGKE